MRGKGERLDRRAFLKTTTLATSGLLLSGAAPFAGRRRGDYRAAGPLIMIDLPGPEIDPESAALIEAHGIRAVCLFQRNLTDGAQTRWLVSELRKLMGPEALVAIDQEGGGVVRTFDLPFPPSAMNLGASGDADLARRVGLATGRGLASLGINWNFAPVLDVNNNPENPVIGDRSFGSDPFLVSRLGLAWARGCQAAGVATCVKHFPGHGDTHVDSHYGLPVVEKDFPQLSALELVPFRTAVEEQVPCFMTSHIVYPALDPEHPATLSASILNGLLRERWAYDGVIITDSMRMKAVADTYGRGEGAVMALRAGADMVMALGSVADKEETLSAVTAATEAGMFTDAARTASLGRLTRLASRFPSRIQSYLPAQRAADARLMQTAWAQGLTAYRNPKAPAPGSRIVLVAPEGPEPGEAVRTGKLSGPALGDRLKDLFELETIYYDRFRPRKAQRAVEEMNRAGSTVVFVSGTRQRLEARVQPLIRAARPDLHVALWNPYNVLDVPAPALITYGFRPEAIDAVAGWFEGRVPAAGTLPIELS